MWPMRQTLGVAAAFAARLTTILPLSTMRLTQETNADFLAGALPVHAEGGTASARAHGAMRHSSRRRLRVDSSCGGRLTIQHQHHAPDLAADERIEVQEAWYEPQHHDAGLQLVVQAEAAWCAVTHREKRTMRGGEGVGEEEGEEGAGGRGGTEH